MYSVSASWFLTLEEVEMAVNFPGIVDAIMKELEGRLVAAGGGTWLEKGFETKVRIERDCLAFKVRQEL